MQVVWVGCFKENHKNQSVKKYENETKNKMKIGIGLRKVLLWKCGHKNAKIMIKNVKIVSVCNCKTNNLTK